jgi:hypothetical protein
MVGRSVGPALCAVTLLAALGTVPARSATWSAVNTVAESRLGDTVETWEASAVDYDNDGDQDVWIGYHDQGGKLWRNDGSGRYTRVAATAWPRLSPEGKVVDRHTCVWADVDRNGRPDAYCSAGRSGANAVKHGMDNELWLQTGLGSFTEVGTAWGVGDPCGRSHYVTFLRANADLYPDIFVGNAPPRSDPDDPCNDPSNGLPGEGNKLFLNDGGAGFHQATGWGITGNSGVRCAESGDFSGDGRDDLLVCGKPTARLYRHNTGNGFTDVAAANHLSGVYSDAHFVDLDTDGDLDLLTAAGRAVSFHRNTGGSLGPRQQITTVPAGGSARAVTAGDADGDGDGDVYVVVANLKAGTNPADRILLNNGSAFTSIAVPGAGGIGDTATPLDGNNDDRAEFLVLNGVEIPGPLQRIELMET